MLLGDEYVIALFGGLKLAECTLRQIGLGRRKGGFPKESGPECLVSVRNGQPMNRQKIRPQDRDRKKQMAPVHS
jgi:hypothetical protein